MFAGEYITVNVTLGNTYIFSMCLGGVGDTQLSLYDESLTPIAYSDDWCGLLSEITWTATYSGAVYLLLDQFPCTDLFSCNQVSITCNGGTTNGDGCNTDVILCQNSAGPFTFNLGGPPVSSCLDWLVNSQFAYIILNIVSTGPLSLLIEGDVPTGFLDVSVFNIPVGIDPCVAIQNPSNEIGCNYAIFPGGCNQFGNSFPCLSVVPSPTVFAGQTIMIVVEDWNNTPSNFFNLQLGPPPNAQSGLPNPSIFPAGPFCTSSDAFQLVANDAGGTWTGPGTTSDGIFTPADAGVGVHVIDYEIGQSPCNASSNTTVTVISNPVANVSVMDDTLCSGESTQLIFSGTPGSVVTYTLNNGPPQIAVLNFLGNATINTGNLAADVSVDILNVAISATPPCSAPNTDPPVMINVENPPIITPIFHD